MPSFVFILIFLCFLFQSCDNFRASYPATTHAYFISFVHRSLSEHQQKDRSWRLVDSLSPFDEHGLFDIQRVSRRIDQKDWRESWQPRAWESLITRRNCSQLTFQTTRQLVVTLPLRDTACWIDIFYTNIFLKLPSTKRRCTTIWSRSNAVETITRVGWQMRYKLGQGGREIKKKKQNKEETRSEFEQSEKQRLRVFLF